MPIDGTLHPDEPLPSATTFEAVEYIDCDLTIFAAADGTYVVADENDDTAARQDEAWPDSTPMLRTIKLRVRVPRPVDEIDAGTFTIRHAAQGAPVTVALRDEPRANGAAAQVGAMGADAEWASEAPNKSAREATS